MSLALSAGLLLPAVVQVCFNYGCASQAPVRLDPETLEHAHALLAEADTALSERIALALVIGNLMGSAARQTPIHRDLPRNAVAESGVDGRMDCIDHSTTNERFLQLLQQAGWLRFHQVEPRAQRAPWLFNVHWTATIRQNDDHRAWAVDTWYRPIGQPAAILPLEDWRRGGEAP